MNWLYEWLSRIGYHHPLHPPATHLPMGLVIGAFIFALSAWIFRRESLARSARHCIVLALLAAPLVALLGLMDWQHFYGGAWLVPIQTKMVLAGVLIALLSLAWRTSRKESRAVSPKILLYALCVAAVAGLGFFGGELVYGLPKTVAASDAPLVRQGAELFATDCAMCHYTDSRENRLGPGLKGLFRQKKLPVSKRAVSADSIANQLKTPFEKMPPFPGLTDQQVEALIAYMKTI